MLQTPVGKAAFGTGIARFVPTLKGKLILIHAIDFVLECDRFGSRGQVRHPGRLHTKMQICLQFVQLF
jgi:hypothetical protein